MKLFFKILFFVLAIFQTNISEAKVFVFDVVVSERIPTVNEVKVKNYPTEISENDFGISCKSKNDFVDYSNLGLGAKATGAKGGKELFNFTKTAAAHMDEAGRMIPVQTLDDIIKAPMAVVKDPRGATNAMMHYSQMWKNGKLYNVEVLYDKATNTIMHFQYGRDAMGPLLKIPK